MNDSIDKIIEETEYLNQKAYTKQEPNISLYQAFKDVINNYLNETDVDDVSIITRQEIINLLFEDYNYYERPLARYGYPEGAYLYSVSTLDNIRNMLEKIGFLGKVWYYDKNNIRKIKLGHYHIIKEIPENLSYPKLRKIYDKLMKETANINIGVSELRKLQNKIFQETFGDLTENNIIFKTNQENENN